MLFRKIRELQGLVNESRKSLALAESKIDNRNKFIYKQQEKINKQEELIERFTNLLNGNKHNSEILIIAKLKELVSDYQSIN